MKYIRYKKTNKAKGVKYQSIYPFIAYVIDELQPDVLTNYSIKHLNGVNELLAEMWSRAFNRLINSHLYYEYRKVTEIGEEPHGDLHIYESYQKGLIQQGKMEYTYEKMDADNYYNQVIKLAYTILLKYGKLSKESILKLKRYQTHMIKVSNIKINRVDWRKLNETKLNMAYKSILNVCKFILQEYMAFDEDGVTRFIGVVDKRRIPHIFEAFVRKFYQSTYGKYAISIKKKRYNTTEDVVYHIPKAEADTVIETDDKVVIIETKYTDTILDNSDNIRPAHINQVVGYTYLEKHEEHNKLVETVLFYAKPNDFVEDIPLVVNHKTGIVIHIRALDLNTSFDNIKQQMKDIFEEIVFGRTIERKYNSEENGEELNEEV